MILINKFTIVNYKFTNVFIFQLKLFSLLAMKKIIFVFCVSLLFASCKKEEPQPQSTAVNPTNPVDTTSTDTSTCIKPKALLSGEWVVYASANNHKAKTFYDPAIAVNVTSTSFGFNGNTFPAAYAADGSVIYTTTASGSGSGQYKVSVYDCNELKLSDGSVQSGMLYEFFLKKKK